MNVVFRWVVAFAAGAAAMYFLDPVTGRRRRSLARDQGVAASHDASHFLRAKSKRAADRMHGVMARTRSRISPEPVEDEQLRERIRAKLGRMVEHASGVQVEVHEGHVVLSGNAGSSEIDELVHTVSKMQGVESVENRLSVGTATPGSPGSEARH